MAKLSVIVPVWGVEKYIAKCARSLFESDLDDIEFIFVDDSTTDNSIRVLEDVIEEYPKRKSQTKIVCHKNNKGLPQARKTGLESATADYVAFVDSDDWIHKSMYAKMLAKANGGGYDIICCDYQYLSDERVIQQSSYPEDSTSDKLKYELISCMVSNAVWNKIYKRTLLTRNDFYFPIASMDEDDVIVCQASYYANKVGYLHETLYYHYENPDSMTHEFSEEKFDRRVQECIENDLWIVNFLAAKPEDWSLAIFNTKMRCKGFIGQQCHKKKYARLMRKTFSDINCEMLFSTRMPLRARLYYMLVFSGLKPLANLLKRIKHAIFAFKIVS